MDITIWDVYQYNIWHLINSYKLEYRWMTVEELAEIDCPQDEEWVKRDPKDKWLNKYQNCKIGLAKDVIKNGTYFPFLVSSINNRLSIYAGKHRYDSLMKLSHIQKVTRKFLIIIFPIDMKLKKIKPFLFGAPSLFSQETTKKYKRIKPNLITYDFIQNIELSQRGFPYLISNPPLIFNNELFFEQWISNPLPFSYFDIIKAYRGKIE